LTTRLYKTLALLMPSSRGGVLGGGHRLVVKEVIVVGHPRLSTASIVPGPGLGVAGTGLNGHSVCRNQPNASTQASFLWKTPPSIQYVRGDCHLSPCLLTLLPISSFLPCLGFLNVMLLEKTCC